MFEMTNQEIHTTRRIFNPSPVSFARNVIGWISYNNQQCRETQRQINRTYNRF